MSRKTRALQAGSQKSNVIPGLMDIKETHKLYRKRGRALIQDWLCRYTRVWRFVLGASLFVFCVLLIAPIRVALQSYLGRWMHIFLTSWSLSLCLTSLAVFLALWVGAVDLPVRRKIHDRPTPRLGGIAVFAGILTSLAVNNIWDPRIIRLLICASLLFALGAVEDITGLSARLRLLSQVALACFMVYSGLVLKLFPQGIILGNAANTVLTVLWFVGITNAFNFFDGMDGLASGLAAIIAGFLGIIAFNTEQVQLGWVSVAILGSALGFLPHNFKPKKQAEIFLGDSGSTMLGFILAGLAIQGEWVIGHYLLNLLPPLLIFGVLIYDMVHTTISRIMRGDVRTFVQWIEYTGKDHLHHRFEALVRSKQYAVILILLLSFCLGLSGLVIRHVNMTLAAILILQSIAVLVLITVLERAGNIHERRKTSR